MKNYKGKKLLIGGQALKELGSSRNTQDVDFLINDPSNEKTFITGEKVDYINCAHNDFLKVIWKMEKENNSEVASLQALAELKGWAWVQHFQNGNFNKAHDCEFDLRFLAKKGVLEFKVLRNFIAPWEFKEAVTLLK